MIYPFGAAGRVVFCYGGGWGNAHKLGGLLHWRGCHAWGALAYIFKGVFFSRLYGVVRKNHELHIGGLN